MAKVLRKQQERLQSRRKLFDGAPKKVQDAGKRPGSMNKKKGTLVRGKHR